MAGSQLAGKGVREMTNTLNIVMLLRSLPLALSTVGPGLCDKAQLGRTGHNWQPGTASVIFIRS